MTLDVEIDNSHSGTVTHEEKEKSWKEIAEAEQHLYRLDPVHYSLKWGIPLSKKYLKDLENRKKEAAKAEKKLAGKK